MKTKMKKDWFGREKSVDELHHDSKIWVSEINLIKDENNITSMQRGDVESSFFTLIKKLFS